MKKSISLLTLLSLILMVYGQDEKRDHIWLLGYRGSSGVLYASAMDFNEVPVKISEDFRNMGFFTTNASICDKSGKRLFYTNGRYIENAAGDTILGSTGINPDPLTQSEEHGQSLWQAALILPKPDSKHLFYLIHEEETWVGAPLLVVTPNLYYTIVDMSFQGGSGLATQVNTVMVQDTLDHGKITATRHANGRDWWIVVGEYDSNRYYRFLLGPNGIEELLPQRIGEAVPSGLGQAHFSPDGTIYAKMNGIDDSVGAFLDIYDFDRCSGLLSNHYRIHYARAFGSQGVAFSPNSRFVYVPAGWWVFQYDLWADDIAASVDTVAEYDGFMSPVWTTFFMAQLAPDGKIYINSPNSVDVLHVIHQPNEKGAACQFEQHGLKLASLNAFSLPNFPNYRLGALEGSPCDTLETVSVVEVGDKAAVELFPNPAHEELWISYPQGLKAGRLVLYDLSGRQVLEVPLTAGLTQQQVEVSALAGGLYVYRVFGAAEEVAAGKVAVVK